MPQIIRAAQRAPPLRGTQAAAVTFALLNARWNLLYRRLADNFGATGLRLRFAFGDLNDSPPNLDCAFLSLQYTVGQTPAALNNLTTFPRSAFVISAAHGRVMRRPHTSEYHLLPPAAANGK